MDLVVFSLVMVALQLENFSLVLCVLQSYPPDGPGSATRERRGSFGKPSQPSATVQT